MSTKQGKGVYGTALCERRTRYDLDDALILEGGAHRISKAAQHKVKMTFYFGSWEGWFMKDTVTDLRYLVRFSSKTRLYKGSDVSNGHIILRQDVTRWEYQTFYSPTTSFPGHFVGLDQ